MKQEAEYSSLAEGAAILLSIWFTAAGRVVLSPCFMPSSSRSSCTAWPEDEGNMILQYVGKHPVTQCQMPED